MPYCMCKNVWHKIFGSIYVIHIGSWWPVTQANRINTTKRFILANPRLRARNYDTSWILYCISVSRCRSSLHGLWGCNPETKMIPVQRIDMLPYPWLLQNCIQWILFYRSFIFVKQRRFLRPVSIIDLQTGTFWVKSIWPIHSTITFETRKSIAFAYLGTEIILSHLSETDIKDECIHLVTHMCHEDVITWKCSPCYQCTACTGRRWIPLTMWRQCRYFSNYRR